MKHKSPFPGMDPYLEEHWGDVHATFMVYAKRQLNTQLPSDLQARVEEALSVEAEAAADRTIYPDVGVVEDRDSPLPLEASPVTVTVAEPIEVPLPNESPVERHIEIIDSGSNRLVTAIELLSPSNKIGETGRARYRRKQAEYIEAGVNLVEIDLLRAGAFVLAVPEELWPCSNEAVYKICIRRASKSHVAGTLGMPLREPLPNIRIPLRTTDTDVVLQLQPIINDCYRDGRYANIDYRKSLQPPLPDDDRAWAEQVVQQGGAQ